MNSRMPSDHVGVLIAALIMVMMGVGGAVLLILNNPPRLGAELWLFFILGHLAVTGLAIPIVRYVNVRLTTITEDPPPGGVIVRQSIWIGLFFVICAWLQILRALSFPAAFFIALVLVVIEVFLRYREISDNNQG